MKIDIYSIMIMAISIMFVLITFYLWLKYGKEDNDMEVIEEFYPPKECNSLETGYIYKRYIDKKDVVSLLIYLANKGYLKIEQTTDQGIFKKSKGFRIIKIKEYEGNNEIEKIFLEELFFHSDNSVTGLQLKDNFEKATEKVKKIISDNKENKEKFFLPRPKKVIKKLTAMILLMYALITIKPIIEFYGIIFGWILTLFQMIITIIGFVFLFISIWGNGPKTTKIVLAIFGNICIIPTLINIIWPALLANKNNLLLYIIEIICIIILIIFIILILLIFQWNNLSETIQKQIYPKKYEQYVNKYSQECDVDNLLIYSIIKVESNFNEKANSHAEAIGLMQLMENTAVETYEHIEAQTVNVEELYQPEINIKIGTYYFSTLLNQYNNVGLALAAYNAGMGRVDKWIKEGTIKQDGSDLENIPFKETNLYVRKVLNVYEKYKNLY